MISVDSTTGNNLLIWVQLDPSYGISSYDIYRETLVPDIYTSIGIVSYNDLPYIPVDTIANPSKRSWKYKVVAAAGGDYSQQADCKAIHLNLTQKSSGAPVNLVWDNYIGFSFSYFYIYRYHSDSISCIDSVLSSTAPIYSYTDSFPPSGYLYYYVAVKLPSVCNPANLKINEGPYSQAISNLEDNRMKADTSLTNINNIRSKYDIYLYPNPSKNKIVIVSNSIGNEGLDIQVYNNEGKLEIRKNAETGNDGRIELDIENLPAGLYIIKYSSISTNGYIKFVKQ